MREIAVLAFVTLDGVMQSPSSPDEDPSGGFNRGGWAAPYWEEAMPYVYAEAMSQPYDLLFGRNTYDTFAAHWPNIADDDPVAARLNPARKYIVTSSSSRPLPWRRSTRISGAVPARIAQLKNEDGPLLQVHGSWQLIQTLHAHRLIDEYRIWTFPVTVGAGKRLFADGAAPAKFELRRFGAAPNGVVMTFYRRNA